MIKKLYISCILLLIVSSAISQKYEDSKYYLIDSLDFSVLDFDDSTQIEKQLKVFHDADNDSIRLQAISDIIEGIKHSVWEDYNETYYLLAKRALRDKSKLNPREIVNYRSHLGAAINNMGYAANRDGNTWKAISYFKESVKFFRLAADSLSVSRVLLGLSSAYHNVGEVQLSNQMDQEALAIAEMSNDLPILCIGHKNLAMKLMMNDYLDEALENALLSLKYSDLMPDNKEMKGRALMGVAQVYSSSGEDSLAADYFTKSLKVSKDFSSAENYVGVLVAYGEACKSRLYHLKEDGKEYKWLLDSTINVFNQVLFLSSDSKFVLTKIRGHTNLGGIYYKLGQAEKALVHANEAYNLALTISNLPKLKAATLIRYRVLKELGRYKEAIEMLEEHNEISEQMDNSESLQIVTQNKMKLEYSVQAAKDSVEFAAAQAIAQKEIENQNDRIAADNRQKWLLYSGISLIAVFSFFLFKKFRQTQHQNKLIENQKEQIIEAHTEMRSSIEYAKRLQAAILPSIESVQSIFKNSFILFKPKDIVSGDFYWFEQYGSYSFIAAADCTGHGVPGAMVSVVCSNALHQSLHEFKLTDPAEILNKTRELVIDTFAKSGEGIKDGMDIALCRIDQSNHEISYSGANNPLWIRKKGSEEISEIKADKQPVGLYEGMKPFASQKLSFSTGDQLFLFTDGYADQFGGEKGKKLKYKPFKKLLIDTSNFSSDEQSNKLDEYFLKWRDQHEQIDDVCVVGIKL